MALTAVAVSVLGAGTAVAPGVTAVAALEYAESPPLLKARTRYE